MLSLQSSNNEQKRFHRGHNVFTDLMWMWTLHAFFQSTQEQGVSCPGSRNGCSLLHTSQAAETLWPADAVQYRFSGQCNVVQCHLGSPPYLRD